MKKIPLKLHGLALLVALQGISHGELVARWNMNEASGTIADSSGNNLTGTPTPLAVTNNALVYGQSSVPAGTYGSITVSAADAAKFGSSIQFIRTLSGMFQIGNPAVIGDLASAGPAGAFTLMAWTNSAVTASTNQRIFATGPSNGWGVGLSNVDQVLFTTFGVVDRRSTNAPSRNNQWQHVAYVWNAGNIEVFINGVSVYTATAGFNNETNAQFGIGGGGNGGDHFNGRMDELKIFNTAMTAEQIVAAALPSGESGPLMAVSSTLNLTSNGTPEVFNIPFTNEGSVGDLTVTAVTPGGPTESAFTVNNFTASVAPGQTGNVALGFEPTGGGLYVATLQIDSNDSISPTRTIALNVNVADPVVTTAARVDFGDLAANPGAQTMSLTLTNNGGATELTFYGVSFLGQGGNGFSVVSSPETVPPGGSGQVVISFDPETATGNFGDLLRIETNATNTPSLTVPVVARVAHSAAATSVHVVNGNFDAGNWNSLAGTAPAGWTSSLAATNSGGLYGQGAPNTPELTSIAAHFQSNEGYYEQNLTTGNSGLTAGTVDAITVALDRFYRNDAATNGHAMLRVSLWDKTNDVEIVGRDLVFENPGVLAGNTFTPAALRLAYDSSTYTDEQIALRIKRVPPLLTASYFQATLVIDNVSVAVDGDWVPQAGYASWVTAMGLDGTPGKENGTADDPDGDGVANFNEFAFGGNPLSGGSGVLSAVSSTDTTGDSQPELILTIAVREDAVFTGATSPSGSAAGVTYSIQGSLDLVQFIAAVDGPLATPVIPATLPATAPAGYKYVSFRLGGSNGLAGMGFLRASALGN